MHTTDEEIAKPHFRLTGRTLLFAAIALCVAAAFSCAICFSLSGNDDINPETNETKEQIEFDKLVMRVESSISELFGREYHCDVDVSAIDITGLSYDDAYNRLLSEMLGYCVEAYSFSCDGKFVAYVADESTVKAAIDAITGQINVRYTANEAISVVSSEISVVPAWCKTGELCDAGKVYELLLGDHSMLFAGAAEALSADYSRDLTSSDSPLFSEYQLQSDAFSTVFPTGDLLPESTLIKYKTYSVDSEQIYPGYETIYIPSAKYAAGEEFIITEGKSGTTVEYYLVHRADDGSKLERSLCSEVVAAKPVNEVIIVGTTEAPVTGKFVWPTNTSIITSYFKEDRVIYGVADVHGGLDIGAMMDSPVWASDGGTVTYAGEKGTYGNLVIIDHGNGYLSYYGHLDVIQVRVGQHVYQGEQIALSGNTGRVTGPHLHFEMRYNSVKVNPLKYISRKTCRFYEEPIEIDFFENK